MSLNNTNVQQEVSQKVRVTYYAPYTEKKDDMLVAYVGFYIEALDLFLSSARLFRKKCGGFYIAPPSEPVKTLEGDKAYRPYFKFGRRYEERFQIAAIQAIDEWCRNH